MVGSRLQVYSNDNSGASSPLRPTTREKNELSSLKKMEGVTVISVEHVLDIFFTLHDPTQLNRQGNDIGTQYRSSMFYLGDQKMVFESAIERAKEIWGDKIVTEVVELGEFYRAEEYHQDFFAKNPNQGYCVAVVAPKVAKVRAKFTDLLK